MSPIRNNMGGEMNSLANQFTHRGLNRRQFGLVLGGGAFLLLAGGSYGVAGRSPETLTTSVATVFGSLAIVRAGRLARLDAQGQPAFRTLAAAASHMNAGRGTGRSMQVRRTSTTGEFPLDGHGHDDGTLGGPAGPEPVNLTWSDVVLVEVELRNAGPVPVLFSPGQLRLKLNASGTTITPRDSDRNPGPIAPHASEHILISYLAPRGASELELDYSDEQRDLAYALALPRMAADEVRS
jgi:hypothetical protein